MDTPAASSDWLKGILAKSQHDSLANDAPLSLIPRPLVWNPDMPPDDRRLADRRGEDERRLSDRRSEDDRREANRHAEDDRRTVTRRSDDVTTEVRQALMDREISLLHGEVNELRERYENLQKDRDRALLWGVMSLGAVVLGMGTWIFNLIVNAAKVGH